MLRSRQIMLALTREEAAAVRAAAGKVPISIWARLAVLRAARRAKR
jgi:hypothetical protein